MSMQLSERVDQVLKAAVRAPSGDNTQPWFFTHGNDGSVEVYIEMGKDNPVLNYRASGTYMALGGLIENSEVAARALGISMKVELLPEGEKSYHVARLSFAEGNSSEDQALLDLIYKRHTNRKAYAKKPLADGVLAAINNMPVEQHTAVHVLTDVQSIKKVAPSLAVMERIALESKKIHDLFFGDIIWKKEENDAGKPGMYIKAMELPLPAEAIFPIFKSWSVTRIANKIGFSRIAALTNGQVYAASSALVLVTMNKEDIETYLRAGMTTERLWHEATKQHLSVQPVTGLIFLARRVAYGDHSELLPQHISFIEHANKVVQEAFHLPPGEIPAMLLRVGYSKGPSVRSARLAPEFR